MAEVWRETKLLPPLCKGPQLIPVDFPDGHQRDQANGGFVCAAMACKVRDQKCVDRDSAKARKLLGKTDPASSKNHQEGQAAREPETLQTQILNRQLPELPPANRARMINLLLFRPKSGANMVTER